MNIIQIQIANDLNSKSQNKSLKMFNILVGTRTLTKNYQTFKKSILEQWMRFLGFLPLFYLSFEASKIPQFKFRKYRHDAHMKLA